MGAVTYPEHTGADEGEDPVTTSGPERLPRRSGSEHRRREFQVGVRLLPEEHTLLTAEVTLTGLSAGELLRRAYFGTEGDDEGR